MTWTRLDHDCVLPGGSAIEAVGALVGSIWSCPMEGCGREWRLAERRRVAGLAYPWTYHWDRVGYGVPTGERTNSGAVTR